MFKMHRCEQKQTLNCLLILPCSAARAMARNFVSIRFSTFSFALAQESATVFFIWGGGPPLFFLGTLFRPLFVSGNRLVHGNYEYP